MENRFNIGPKIPQPAAFTPPGQEEVLPPQGPTRGPTISNIPDELLSEVFSYLNPAEQREAGKVSTRWKGVAVDTARNQANAMMQKFADFLLGNLPPDSYESQIEKLQSIKDTSRNVLGSQNFAEIKSSAEELKAQFAHVLMDLTDEDFAQLEKQFKESRISSPFVTDVFETVKRDLAKIKQLIESYDFEEVEKAIQGLLATGNVDTALEITEKRLKARPNISKRILETLVMKGHLNESASAHSQKQAMRAAYMFAKQTMMHLTKVEPRTPEEIEKLERTANFAASMLICQTMAENGQFDEAMKFAEKTPQEEIKQKLIQLINEIQVTWNNVETLAKNGQFDEAMKFAKKTPHEEIKQKFIRLINEIKETRGEAPSAGQEG